MKKTGKISTIVILAAVVIFLAVGNIVGISAEAGSEALTIKAMFFSESVKYSDIESIDLQSGISYGTRSFGNDFLGVKSGNFHNAAFDSYRCAVYSSQPNAAVILKADGSYVVFNLKESSELEKIVDEVKNKIL